jgi:dTDP-4-amino-4,6-dideoxygalactose transaminase
MVWRLFVSDLDYGEEEVRAVAEVVRSRWLTMGPQTEAFEQEVAAFLGCKHAVMLASGTAALHVALRALDIGSGDEVVVPSLSFVATANAVVYCGATPIFADILHPENPTIDPDDARRKITPHTRALIPMHYGGFACQMAALKEIAAACDTPRGVSIVEDAAHALGAADASGHSLGTIATLGCFSFFSNKNMATGEGGLVVTDDECLARKARSLRSHGLTSTTFDRHSSPTPGTYDVVELGYNYRPTEIAAALARVQLQKLPRLIARRRELFLLYHSLLSEVGELSLPFENPDNWGKPGFHLFPVLCKEEERRDDLRAALHARGIQTSWHYRPIHTLHLYSASVLREKEALPQSERFARHEVTLPLHTRMNEDDVTFVVNAVKEALAHR